VTNHQQSRADRAVVEQAARRLRHRAIADRYAGYEGKHMASAWRWCLTSSPGTCATCTRTSGLRRYAGRACCSTRRRSDPGAGWRPGRCPGRGASAGRLTGACARVVVPQRRPAVHRAPWAGCGPKRPARLGRAALRPARLRPRCRTETPATCRPGAGATATSRSWCSLA
jgi:hypothetical protein